MPVRLSCPSCRKPLTAKDELAGKKVKCPGCGHVFAVPVPEPEAPASEASGFKASASKCPNCGSILEPGAQICVECGTHLATPARYQAAGVEPAKKQKSGEGKLAFIVGSVVAAVIIIGCLTFGLIMLTRKAPSMPGGPTEQRQVGPTGEAKTLGLSDEAVHAKRKEERPRIQRIEVDGKTDDWDAAGIAPLEEIEWAFADGMGKEGRKRFEGGKLIPLDAEKVLAEERRIKSIRIAHDAQNLYLLLELDPGIREYFEEKGSGTYISHVYVDSDNNESTGTVRVRDEKSPGWDFHIHLRTSYLIRFVMSARQTIPTASYLIERLKKVVAINVQGRKGKLWDTEDVAGGECDTEDDPAYIAFAGKFLEVRFPLKALNITPPAEIRLLIQDDYPWPAVAVEIPVSLGK